MQIKLKSTCNVAYQVFCAALAIVGLVLVCSNTWNSMNRWVHVFLIALTFCGVVLMLLFIDQYEANEDGVIRKSLLGKQTTKWSEVRDAYYIYYDTARCGMTVECVVLVKDKHPKRLAYHRAMFLVIQNKATVFSVSSQAYKGRSSVPYFQKKEFVTLAEKQGVWIIETQPRGLGAD